MTEAKPKASAVLIGIGAIIKALGEQGISKDKRNKEQGYAFRGIDDVLNALNPLLVEHDLVIVPSYFDRIVDGRPTKSGGMMYNVSITGQFEFISLVDGSEKTVGPFVGEAQDSADKATNKAMSASYKAMAFQTFCIPTEGMQDADSNTPEETVRQPPPPPKKPPSAAQQKIADGLLADLETTDDPDALWKHPNTQKYLKAWHADKSHDLYDQMVRAAKAAKKRVSEQEKEPPPADPGVPFNDDIPF